MSDSTKKRGLVAVLVVEDEYLERTKSALRGLLIPYYEMNGYFAMEQFTTLEEVEFWDKN